MRVQDIHMPGHANTDAPFWKFSSATNIYFARSARGARRKICNGASGASELPGPADFNQQPLRGNYIRIR